MDEEINAETNLLVEFEVLLVTFIHVEMKTSLYPWFWTHNMDTLKTKPLIVPHNTKEHGLEHVSSESRLLFLSFGVLLYKQTILLLYKWNCLITGNKDLDHVFTLIPQHLGLKYLCIALLECFTLKYIICLLLE